MLRRPIPTGRIAVAGSAAPRYVVAPPTLELAGRQIAATSSLVLYKIRPPVRLGETVDGIYPDRWMGSDAGLTRYAGQDDPCLALARWRGQGRTFPAGFESTLARHDRR